MAVRRGAAIPSKIYRGTVPVQRVMRGTVEVWSASPYPLTGTYGPTSYPVGGSIILVQHTIVEAGSYTLTHTATSTGNYFTVAIGGPWGKTAGNTTSSPGQVATATTTRTLAPGDQITFEVAGLVAGQATGTCSITKN